MTQHFADGETWIDETEEGTHGTPEEWYLEVEEYAFHVYLLHSRWYMKIWCDVPTKMTAVLAKGETRT